MNSDEILDELNILQPPIIEAIQTASAEVGSLDPPSEFAEDHDIIEAYFVGILEVSEAISQAAQDRDVDAQRSEFTRSGTVTCRAASALSDDAKDIAQFFGDDPAMCPQ
jgi:hypothetical protein